MLKRRGFLGGILSAGFAPAFIGSQVLMPVKAIAKPRQWQDLLNTEAMARAVDNDLLQQFTEVYVNGILLRPLHDYGFAGSVLVLGPGIAVDKQDVVHVRRRTNSYFPEFSTEYMGAAGMEAFR